MVTLLKSQGMDLLAETWKFLARMPSAVRIADGSLDFSGGCDSGRVTTVQSQNNPNGLPRTMLAWMDSCTVRGGGISPRDGFVSLCKILDSGLYQSGYLYEPQFADPYHILQISGRIYQVNTGTDNSVIDLSAKFGITNPPDITQGWMAQGEQFLIIQAGDIFTNPIPTLPLFWDGTTLRRSIGITNSSVAPGTPGVNELPAAGPMVYYQGRLWYAQGRSYGAGDIVDGPSGTLAYDFEDAILNVTENPLAVGGDNFSVPATAGNITALFFTANLDTTLGQGPLYIGTRKQIYQLVVPVTRTDWIAANNTNQPVQTIAQLRWGPTSDRCIVHVNGDVFYQSLEPAIRSLFVSVRYFQQWANVSLSRNLNRVLQFNNRALMPFANGIEFNNRLYQAILPVQTPCGVTFQGIASLDFDIISSFGSEGVGPNGATTKPPPAWEGMLEGLQILQLFEGDFGGLQRAFALCVSSLTGAIEMWELTDFLLVDNNPVNDTVDNRIGWYFETPAYTFGEEFDPKQLDGAEIWVDQISGTVDLQIDYRVDADPCWQPWTTTQFCAARTAAELDPATASNYPQATFCRGYQFPIGLPSPQLNKCASMMKRPANQGYQFQMRIIIKGSCRIRGILLYALPLNKQPFVNVACPPAVTA